MCELRSARILDRLRLCEDALRSGVPDEYFGWAGDQPSLGELAQSDMRPESPTLPQGEGSEPVGWRLVPIEPTPEMLNVTVRQPIAVKGTDTETIRWHLWQAMLAAAPSPPPLPAGNADPCVREVLEKVRRWFKGRLQGKPVGDPGNALADLDQAITLLLEAAKWRPIETAPKDGTYIVGGWSDVAEIIHWSVDEDCWLSGINEVGIPPLGWFPIPSLPESAVRASDRSA